MKRREFITLLSSAVALPILRPLTARAQQPAMPMAGFLSGASSSTFAQLVRAFREGLSENGFVEGQNVAIEFRWAENQYDRLPALAKELVGRQAAVIAAVPGMPPALAARAATTAIPIVFLVGTDPVEVGLVASLNRPGGNLTGVTTLGSEIGPKRLELLRELVPTATVFVLLVNPANPAVAEPHAKDLQAAARTLGLQLRVLHASTERDLDTVFATLVEQRAGGLVIAPDSFFFSRSKEIAELSLRHAVPAIYQYRNFAATGGLMSYGASDVDQYRLVGVYTGRILKGEKPADLPVQQSAKVELIINLKTAKAFGLTVPLTLLGRADEVIE